jgi:uncharacterized membrane protein
MRQILLPLLVSLVSVVLGFAISLVLAVIVGNIFGTGRGVVVFFVSYPRSNGILGSQIQSAVR